MQVKLSSLESKSSVPDGMMESAFAFAGMDETISANPRVPFLDLDDVAAITKK